MGCASLFLGVLSIIGTGVGLLPLANFLNCINLPVALVGASLALVDLARQKAPGESRGPAVAGLVLNGLALLIGTTRFLISLFTTGGIV
jgi:hypothetical protein